MVALWKKKSLIPPVSKPGGVRSKTVGAVDTEFELSAVSPPGRGQKERGEW